MCGSHLLCAVRSNRFSGADGGDNLAPGPADAGPGQGGRDAGAGGGDDVRG